MLKNSRPTNLKSLVNDFGAVGHAIKGAYSDTFIRWARKASQG